MSSEQRLVPGRGLKAQLDAFAALGLDVPAMLREMAVDGLEKLSEPDSLVRVEAFHRMWASARARDTRPGLPTALARVIPFGAFGLIDYLVGSSDTVSGALHSLALHFRLATYEARLELDACAGHHWIRMRPTQGLADDAAEFMTVSVLERLRSFTNGALRVHEVALTRAPPVDRAIYDDPPGDAFTFGAPVAGFAIAADSLELPLNRSDRHLRETLSHVAASLHLDFEKRSDIEMALRARLRDALASRTAEPAAMAKMLGISERTLQRRLADRRLSFRDLVDSFRHEEALRLLGVGKLPLAEISARLGFNEQSSFTRAFGRWTGSTPAAWRRARHTRNAG